MQNHFFIEFRLRGYSRDYSKWVISRVRNKARELGIKGIYHVPHMALFGSAKTNNLKRVIGALETLGKRYSLVPFKIAGLRRFEGPRRVIYLDIDPSPELIRLRKELAENLIEVSDDYSAWDIKTRFKFHSTIGIFPHVDQGRFEKLCKYAEYHCRHEDFRQYRVSFLEILIHYFQKYIFRTVEEERGINQHLLRITILGRKSKITYEYDLVLKRLLNRREALGRYWWRKTIEKLRDLQNLA